MLTLDLPIVSIDVANPLRALDSIRETLQLLRPKVTYLLTDIQRFQAAGIVPKAASYGICLRDHFQTNRQHHFPGVTRSFFPDYEMALMTEPLKHVGAASHLLYMEWDAGVINPLAWDPDWLQFDFIGAPWPPHNNPGWPACDGETNAVGNTGFSLQSKRFMEAIRDAILEFPNDQRKFCSDSWMCRTMRPWLEERGIVFAPVEVAARFSCENRVYSGQFGFHGRSTVRLNNWQGRFKSMNDNKP